MTISKIDPTDHSLCGIFHINIMSSEVKRSSLFTHFKINQSPDEKNVDVTMQINGVSVDFKRSLEEMWTRLSDAYDADVLKSANALIAESRVYKLNQIIYEAEQTIRNELEKLQLIEKDSED